MHSIAPTEKDTATVTLEKRLWEAADQVRANSGLTAAQYAQPVLGLIFLRFAEVRFAAQRAKLEKAGERLPSLAQRACVRWIAPLARDCRFAMRPLCISRR
jgi:type I restriction enzyme M protein